MKKNVMIILSLGLILSSCGSDSNNATNGATTNNGSTDNGTTDNGPTTNNGLTPTTNTASTICNKYCELAMTNCTEGNSLYTEIENCLTICEEDISDTGTDCSADPSSCIPTGDNIQCRLHHVDLAARNPALNCDTAANNPEGFICSDTTSMCEFYCAAHEVECTGANSQTDSYEDCLIGCSTIPDSGFDCAGTLDCPEDAEDTIQCRVNQLYPTYYLSDADKSLPCENSAIVSAVCK